MSSEAWAALKAEFAALADLPAPARAERLARLAATRPALHERVAALLRADAGADALLRHLESTDATDTAAGAGDADEEADADPFGLAGTTVSHFRILDVLGRGGMGVVYRALDIRLGRMVALKFMLPQLSCDTFARERFLKEARAASALDHPNVCTVYDTGRDDGGRVFLAMACYEGETLRARLAQSATLDLRAAIDIASQVLRGLGAAHRAGITHGDLKPGNLLLAADGMVRILDFGLARARNDIDPAGPGLPPGTIAYMSPEQLEGGTVDHRTDLWSVGVVLHEMLTGGPPFRRGSELSSIHSILHDVPVAISALRPELPATLDAVVHTLLAKDPRDRYASADDALAALTAATTAGGGRRALRRRRLAGAIAGTAAIAAVLGISTAVRLARAAEAARTASVAATVAGAEAAAPNTIAVLPFADLGFGLDEQHFGEGIAEEIMNALHQVRELRVTSRASAFSFRDSQLSSREIANRLGVRTLLGGSVRRTGSSVRIVAWLVDAPSDRELWSHSFEAELDDIAAVQTEIVRAAIAATEVRLAAEQSVAVRRASLSHAAHEAYLHGLSRWHRRTPADIAAAVAYFERAVAADSMFARAWAGLALAHAVLPILSGNPAADAVSAIETAAARALSLDPMLADPHAALGYAYHQQWRWHDAEREFRRALELEPDHITALQWHGEHLAKMGRPAEAERLLRRAVELDPLSIIAHTNLGLVLWLGSRTHESIAQFELTARMNPAFPIAQLFLFRARTAVGDLDGARLAGRTWAELSGQADPDDIETVMRAVRGEAPHAAGLDVLSKWEQSPQRLVDIVLLAPRLGDTQRALALLERGFEEHNPLLSALRVGVWSEPLRKEPRYLRLVERLRLPE
jgi:eukaryotic-like serine/threonine-protein kinase